jgi:serine/threonine-protein kinase RsbW
MSEPARVNRTMRSDPAVFGEARRFVWGTAERAGLSPRDAHALAVAVSETFANVHRHAYGGRRDGRIDLVVESMDGRVVVSVRHAGVPFDPDRYVQPDLSRPAERGYGVYLISRLVDAITYEMTDDGAVVVLVKQRASTRSEPDSREENA